MIGSVHTNYTVELLKLQAILALSFFPKQGVLLGS